MGLFDQPVASIKLQEEHAKRCLQLITAPSVLANCKRARGGLFITYQTINKMVANLK